MIFFKKVLILALTIVMMMVAYYVYRFLRKIINPRKSFPNLLLFFFLNLLAVFLLIFLLSLFLFIYRNFFFTM
ncbi:MAG: hypothetical protein ABJA57_10790 [Ginsengibacter sp.]